MHQIVCDKCQKTEPVQWTQMFVGWLHDPKPLLIEPGKMIRVDKRAGEYLGQLGHGSLPIPEGWLYHYGQDLDDDTVSREYAHLCPACKSDVPDRS